MRVFSNGQFVVNRHSKNKWETNEITGWVALGRSHSDIPFQSVKDYYAHALPMMRFAI